MFNLKNFIIAIFKCVIYLTSQSWKQPTFGTTEMDEAMVIEKIPILAKKHGETFAGDVRLYSNNIIRSSVILEIFSKQYTLVCF